MADDPEPSSRKDAAGSEPAPLWIAPFDRDGHIVDPSLIEAAQQIKDAFFRYRRTLLRDEAVILDLIEKAVHRASRSRNGRALDNPVPYLFRIFMHLANAEIRKECLLVPLKDRVLYRRADCDVPPDLDEALDRRMAIEKLTPRMYRLLMARSMDVSIRQIAEAGGVKPNTIYKRISRTKKARKKLLDGNSTKAPLSGPDDKGHDGSKKPAGSTSSSGSERAA
jgi:DNA-directed RNA polymerase specialized sigma24 family protein